MGRNGRWIAGLRGPGWGGLLGRCALAMSAAVLPLLALPVACTQSKSVGSSPANAPLVRVRLLNAQDRVTLTAAQPPLVRVANSSGASRLNVAAGVPVVAARTAGGWSVGGAPFPAGELTLQPATEGSLGVNGQPYRGRLRLVPSGAAQFDVVNDVDVDGYLKGVLPKELPARWDAEAYRAQAIVARTYALYHVRTDGVGRSYDVLPDERSQVYGGLAAETDKARDAADQTSGVVVAYGQPGRERIFQAYFSSCCGGITQSAADAFGEAYIEPLSDQDVHGLCSQAPRFNWGPVVVTKAELTRRFRLWGQRKNRPEQAIGPIAAVAIQFSNRWGRPTRFLVTDAAGNRYSLEGEELRWAVNTDAQPGTTLASSFCKPISGDPDVVRFVEGHGLGHGVGMCQWCAQTRAASGMRHEDIVLAAFQHAKLVRAY